MGPFDDDVAVHVAADVHAEDRAAGVADDDGHHVVGRVEPDATGDAGPVVGCPVRSVTESTEEPNRFSGGTSHHHGHDVVVEQNVGAGRKS